MLTLLIDEHMAEEEPPRRPRCPRCCRRPVRFDRHLPGPACTGAVAFPCYSPPLFPPCMHNLPPSRCSHTSLGRMCCLVFSATRATVGLRLVG